MVMVGSGGCCGIVVLVGVCLYGSGEWWEGLSLEAVMVAPYRLPTNSVSLEGFICNVSLADSDVALGMNIMFFSPL